MSRKAAVLTLRISEEDQADLKRAADQRNQSVSEYVRSVVRGDVTELATGTTFSDGSPTKAARETGAQWITGGSENLSVYGSTLTINASAGSPR